MLRKLHSAPLHMINYDEINVWEMGSVTHLLQVPGQRREGFTCAQQIIVFVGRPPLPLLKNAYYAIPPVRCNANEKQQDLTVCVVTYILIKL